MKLHLVPLGSMSKTMCKDTDVVKVHLTTDQGTLCSILRRHEKDELDRLLPSNDWPVEWRVETDRGRAALLLTRSEAVSVSDLLKADN